MATLIENCRISPPENATVPELTLPLTFLDIGWITFRPIRRLIFYEFSCSKPEFLNKVVPELKQSLSLTLKHYLPLAGNLLYPHNTDDETVKPFLRYVTGDSFSLTLAESTKDFDCLTGYDSRDADEFYDFVPYLPPVTEDKEYKILPVVAVQVTLFPNRGICMGFSNRHVVGDASSIVGFIKAWASVTKFAGDEELIMSKDESLPVFDRSYVKDPLGIDTIYWRTLKTFPVQPDTFSLPTERVRKTLVLDPTGIKKLKELVLSKNPGLGYVSSFVVSTAYAWTCFVKSVEEEPERDDLFVFVVDVRARVTPPVPANYFGNCLAYTMAKISHSDLVGDQGFVLAATTVAENIRNKVNKKDEVLKGAENWMSDMMKYLGTSILAISGSPKFDLYGVDFGWGRAKKVEALTIDSEKYSMSLSKSRDFEGGLEFGFSLPKDRMDKFSAIFVEGLKFDRSM